MPRTSRATTQEPNHRLNSLEAKPVEIGRPEMLGELFRKTDAVGIAMLTSFKQEDRTLKMAVGMSIIRVKQRLLYT